jgi:hypothetical protein
VQRSSFSIDTCYCYFDLCNDIFKLPHRHTAHVLHILNGNPERTRGRALTNEG